MADKGDMSQIERLIQSKEGQDVLQAFGASYANTQNFGQAFEAARQVAESNGVWIRAEVALFLEILKFVGPPIITGLQKLFREWQQPKGK